MGGILDLLGEDISDILFPFNMSNAHVSEPLIEPDAQFSHVNTWELLRGGHAFRPIDTTMVIIPHGDRLFALLREGKDHALDFSL
jgi:hypothetical protein